MRVQVDPLINVNGNFVDDNKEISSILNNYFASVFTMENVSTIFKVVDPTIILNTAFKISSHRLDIIVTDGDLKSLKILQKKSSVKFILNT